MTEQLILITGGSSGIGKAAAKLLFQKGHRIILQARTLDKMQAAAQEIDPSGQRVYIYSTDLTKPEAVEAAAQQIIAEVGLPDVIINSAGAGEWLTFKEATLSHFEETVQSPYLATAYTCKVFHEPMLQRGSGHFIIVNSGACYISLPGAVGYLPSRAAMLGFARALHADLYRTPLKVSMVAFGKVNTPYFQANPRSEARIPKAAAILVPPMSEAATGRVL
ncbi:MAG TPA: hypothetical protein DCR93_00335, partial [Cytophagales bacterium]|nr:hypothetical protein [Cytophagales bacterium]